MRSSPRAGKFGNRQTTSTVWTSLPPKHIGERQACIEGIVVQRVSLGATASLFPPLLATSGGQRIVERQAQLPTHPRMHWNADHARLSSPANPSRK